MGPSCEQALFPGGRKQLSHVVHLRIGELLQIHELVARRSVERISSSRFK